MASILGGLNLIYGYTVCSLGFLSAACLAAPLALIEPLRNLGSVPHTVLICLRDVLVELAWKPMMVMLWAANIRVHLSRPDSYRFPGEGGWLPDRQKSRRFVVNANHQNLGDTLVISYLLNAFNATNGSGMWTIWETYKKLPLLWACHLAGHLFLSKRTAQEPFDFSSFQRDQFSHLLVYAEGGCRDAEAKVKAQQYASERCLPCPRHTLLPRAGLLHLVLPDLKKAGAAELVDLTISYPPGCSALTSKWSLTEFGTLKWQPFDVHINMRVIPLSSLGSSLEEIQQGLYRIYEEKDALLEHCATEGCFLDSQPIVVPIRWWIFQTLVWLTLLWCLFKIFLHVVVALLMASKIFWIASALSAVLFSVAWCNIDALRLTTSCKPYFVAAALVAAAFSASACSLPSHPH